jgi:hypothetical protein
VFTRNIRRVQDRRHGGPVEWPTQWGSELPDFNAYSSLALCTFGAVVSLKSAIEWQIPWLLAVAAVCALFAGFYLTNLSRRRRTLSTRIRTTGVDPETGTPLADAYVPGSMATLIPGRPVVHTAWAVITTLLALGFAFTYWAWMHSTGTYPAMRVMWAVVVSGLALFGVVYTARLLRNPRRIAIVVTPDTLWIHRALSSHRIAWDEVTDVEPVGRRLAFLQSRRERARDRVSPGIKISHGGRTVDVHALAHDIDPAVLLHLLQTLHTSPQTRDETGDGRTVAGLADLYTRWDEEYR